MKKNYIIFILSVIFLILLSLFLYKLISNKNVKKEKFYLDDTYYNSTFLIEVSKDQIKELEDKKASFLVFVKLPGCSSCEEFQKVLKEFISNNSISFYTVEYKDRLKGTKMYNKVKYSPSVVIYQNGEVRDFLDANSDNDIKYYESSDGLKSFLEKSIYLKK